MTPDQNRTPMPGVPTDLPITLLPLVLLGGGGAGAGEEQSCPVPGGAAPCILSRFPPCCPQHTRDGWRTKGYQGPQCQGQKWDLGALLFRGGRDSWKQGKNKETPTPGRNWRLRMWTPASSASAHPESREGHVGGRRWWDWDSPASRCLESCSPTQHGPPQPSLWHQSPSKMKIFYP